MVESAVSSALNVFAYLAWPLLLAIAASAIIAGMLQATTQIEDRAISFAAKIAGLVLVIYVGGGRLFPALASLSRELWGK